MEAIIIAGGKGTRLKSLSKDIPKPMVEIAGKPILEHQVNLLQNYGVRKIFIMTGHLGHVIEDYFGDGKKFDVAITYYREDSPLGTSGCVKLSEDAIHDDFLVLYGDVVMDFKIDDFVAFHKSKGGSGTLLVHPNDHPYDSDLVVIDDEHRIAKFLLKDQKPEYYKNLASAAVYILTPEVFKYIPEGKSDFSKDVFPEMLKNSERLYGYKTAEYIKDMGTIDRFEKVSEDFLQGKVQRLSKQHKRPAIFFDRDGTLIKDIELLHKIEDLELFPYSASAIKKVNGSDFLSFLITNQPVVARNLCNISTVNQIHNKLETLLGKDGAYLNDVYFCPHHPDKGYPEENPDFKIDCDCRKPKTGMIDRAVNEYNVDLGASWFVGDTTTDIQAGANAGLNTVLVRTGKGGKDKKFSATPDFIFGNIEEAVNFILYGRKTYEDIAGKIIHKISEKNNNSPFIVSVGGASRSGKSTFVRWLKHVLNQNSISNTVIELDNWLIGVHQREESMTVKERYRYQEIETDINKLLTGEKILMSLYDPYSRTIRKKQDYSLSDEQCVIIVGVPALDIAGLRTRSNIKIYMEVNETERKQRFFSFYRWKDLPDESISRLYEQRIKDEISIIESTKEHADLVISN